MMRRHRTRFVPLAVLLSTMSAAGALAADRTWVGRSFFNNNWGDSANWDLFAWPNHGDTPLFTFHGATRTTPFVDYGVTLPGLRFIDFGAELPAPSYTINGSRILTMTGALYNEGRNAQRVNTTIRIGEGGTFRNDTTISGRLTIGGTVDTLGNQLNVYAGAAGMYILGPIGGTGSLVKRGVGILELSANNTYTGDTQITNGILRLVGNGRLSSATDLSLTDTGHLEMFGITQTVSSLAGGGTVRGGTLVVATGGSYDGRLDIDGLIKRGTFALDLWGVSTHVGSAIIEQGALRLFGAGRLHDSTELTILSAGTFELQTNVTSSLRTLNGAGRIRLESGSTLIVSPSTVTAGSFSGNIDGNGGFTKGGVGLLALSGANSYTGDTLVEAGTLSVTPAAVSDSSAVIVKSGLYSMAGSPGTYAPPSLEVQNLGTARLAAGADKILRTSNVATVGAGTLDLADNDMILTAASLEAIAALIASARNGSTGRWTGPGLTSSAAAANPLTGLAVALIGNEVHVKYTYNGDANLDGLIDADDYFRIDSGFLNALADPAFTQGDFNHDNTIDADDYFLIDSAFLGQGTPLVNRGHSLPLASVPEPAASLVLISLSLTLTRRVRRGRA